MSKSQANTTKKERYYEPAPQDIDVENFKKVIRSRRSVRNFTNTPIPSEILDECLDLALLAPNSSNLQPWTFYVVQDTTKKKQLVKACMSQFAARTAAELIVCVARTDRIDQMAKYNIEQFPFPEIPPLVKKYYKYIHINYKTGYFDALGKFKKAAFFVARKFNQVLPITAYTDADAKLWAAKTTALACENLVLALRAHGFDSCMMEGIDEPMIRKILNLAKDEIPIMVIAAGERSKEGVFFPQYRFDRDLFIKKI